MNQSQQIEAASIQPLPNTDQTQPEKPKKKFPIFWILILLAILAAGGFTYFYISSILSVQGQLDKINHTNQSDQTPTPIPNSTANWKTYRNDEYGFEFKYPQTHEVAIDDPDGKKNPKVIRTDDSYAARGLYIDWEPIYEGDLNRYTSATSFNASQTEMGGSLNISFTIGGKIFFFGCQLNENTQDRLEEIKLCNQILSTFKFLDTTNPSDISSWPTTAPELFSTDQTYVVNQRRIGDYNHISIDHIDGLSITKDLVKDNEKEIGMGTKIKCQCGVTVGKWISYTQFTLIIVNSLDEEYEYTVDAPSGKVIESSFKRVK